MNDNNVKTIQRWLSIEEDITKHSSVLRELRKQKKDLNLEIVAIMKLNDVECFDCNSGQITYTKRNVKKGLSKKSLNEILRKYFEDAQNDEVDKICEYIQDNRTIEEKEGVKLKKNKI